MQRVGKEVRLLTGEQEELVVACWGRQKQERKSIYEGGSARAREGIIFERVSSLGKRLRRVRFPLPVLRRVRRVVF